MSITFNHPPAVATLDPESDEFDLDADIAEALIQTQGKTELERKRKKLARMKEGNAERDLLLADIRKMEEGIVWRTAEAVALFHTQTCTTCGSKHKFFMGWMAGQDHIHDKTCHRLIRGKPIESLPEKIVEHDMGSVEMCSDCVEACIIINSAIKGEL